MQTTLPDGSNPLASGGRTFADWLAQRPRVNWYQTGIVAVTIFAIAMELMFPPRRIVLGNGLSVYAGHFTAALPSPQTVQPDYLCLTLELVAIVAIAAIGWKLGASGRRFERRIQHRS